MYNMHEGDISALNRNIKWIKSVVVALIFICILSMVSIFENRMQSGNACAVSPLTPSYIPEFYKLTEEHLDESVHEMTYTGASGEQITFVQEWSSATENPADNDVDVHQITVDGQAVIQQKNKSENVCELSWEDGTYRFRFRGACADEAELKKMLESVFPFYSVKELPDDDGIGHSLYVASCEPFCLYLEHHQKNWIYLFQPEVEDPYAEKIIYKADTHPSETYFESLYEIETLQTDIRAESQTVSVAQSDTLLPDKNRIQVGLNALAAKTSEEHPLYLVWYSGNLYAVIDHEAYHLFRDRYGGKDIQTVPQFILPEHTICVKQFGPITQQDYQEKQASPA